ncbi:MAG: NAD(P)H-dependent oxidoreductase subunit E [Phycisphaerae bacterium]
MIESVDIDLSFVDEAVRHIGRSSDKTIPLLQAIQARYRYLPREALKRVCELTDITPAQIAGVSTFYTQFRHSPVGKHMISVCHGTACHVKGSRLVQDALMRALGIEGAEDTSRDGLFTVQKVACLGCCTLAPVIQIDHVTYGHLTPDTIGKVLADFLDLEAARAHAPHRPPHVAKGLQGEIRVGLGSCCVAKGSSQLHDLLGRIVEELGLDVAVKRVGCVGMCHQTPMVEVIVGGVGGGAGVPPARDVDVSSARSEGVSPSVSDARGQDARATSHFYARVHSEDAKAIVLRHFKPKGVARRISTALSRLLDKALTDEEWPGVEHFGIEVRDPPVEAFLGPQRHLATEHCGRLDPLNIDEYIGLGGFEALRRCLTRMQPQQIIDEITRSGLRGRGGAGFPTGIKWAAVRAAGGDEKQIIVNGDEGDPGAFMDRMILESYPYRVIEGVAIAAYAVGSRHGVFYIRAEYPLAVRRVGAAIKHCQERGLLGKDIAGSGFDLDLRIMEGAGAFVCGEETALMASVEGRRGMPRLRPPYPAQSGLWGRPTLINNVETYSLVPWIMRNGAAAFAALGTGRSKGTKVFALAGKVARGGLIEVPMGVTLRQVVEDIGGGIAGGLKFKAVQVGGPSGGCLPAEVCDLPIDYEEMTGAGAIMGSGGLVVLDENDCMVDIARYFLEFTQDQSCGKCTFCRIGTRRMLDILNRLCEGHGRKGDLEELETLARQVQRGSLCGLGKTAPNPILTTLRYFRPEYEAHLNKHCPAGRCKALIRYVVTDDCIGCTKCSQVCPSDAIPMRPYEKHEIDDTKCIRCDTCRGICPTKAIRIE